MQLISKTALALALTFGMVSAAPVVAQKASKAPSLKLSEPVRAAIIASQTARKAGDTATATAKTAEAKAVAKTPDENFVVGQESYEIGKLTNSASLQADGIDAMLQSGKVPEENQAAYYVALGQLSYNGKNFQRAEAALTKAQAMNAPNPEIYALLAETKNQLGKPAEALAMIQQAAAKQKAAGTQVPEAWLQRGMAIGMQSKSPTTVDLSYEWLAAYPTKSNWRDSIVIAKDVLKVSDPELDVDYNRLQRAAGALKGERDFVDYAEQTYLKFPGEAKAVIDEGVAAGSINLASMRSAKELQGIASGKITADKASLSKNPATGRAALGNADAFAGYGDYATAISLYKQALAKGGVDANTVNTRLGVALYRSGDKAGAKQVFASITGTRAPLAKYWMTLIDHPVAG